MCLSPLELTSVVRFEEHAPIGWIACNEREPIALTKENDATCLHVKSWIHGEEDGI